MFVLASKTETQGIVLAEAAIHKLPMVILDAPVTSDFVSENNLGIISERRSFAKNVLKLLNNGKTKEKYIQNSDNVKEKYSIENCTKKFVEVYQQAKEEKNHCQ